MDGDWYRCITRDNINAHHWNIRQDWVSFDAYLSTNYLEKYLENFLLVRYLTIHLFDEPEITCQKIDKYLIYYKRLVYIVNLYKRNLKSVIFIYFSIFCTERKINLIRLIIVYILDFAKNTILVYLYVEVFK